MINIEVYENFSGSYELMGEIIGNTERGKLSTSFVFDKEFLKRNRLRFNIDPDIKYYNGPQWTNNKTGLFKIFEDTCPDRWGRRLIEKREKIYAKNEKRLAKSFNEIDYMLNVNDECRMGSLRYKIKGEDEFISVNNGIDIPPITSLRALEDASFAFEKNDDESKWLEQLVYQGSSLGGARPKANVKDENGILYIAKFPSINDEVDVGLIEKWTVELAGICNINVPETMLIKISDKGHIFLSKRFDREYFDCNVNRLFYMSMMTALDKNDGDIASYLDIVSCIRENLIDIDKDLLELYKRLIFNIMISNTDDHLRNHALIFKNNKLTLSPAFDLMPNVYNNGNLSLNIDENNSELSLELALSTSKYYGINSDKAKILINDMKNKIEKNAKVIANKLGMKKNGWEMVRECIKVRDTV